MVNKEVHLPNGEVTLVSHTGSCQITKTNETKNVLFVPVFQYNLLSVSKVTRDLKFLMSFYPDFCLFQDLSSGNVKAIGREKGGLYLLIPQIPDKSHIIEKIINKSLSIQGQPLDVSLWHRRSAHASRFEVRKL